MMLRLFLPLLFGFALCATISAQKVTYDTVQGTDFSRYKTYKWKRTENTRYPDQAKDEILTSSIDEQLAAKGLVKTEDESADLYVVYQLAVTDDITLNSYKTGAEWITMPTSTMGASAATNSSYVVKKGWLLLGLYDVKQKKVVWRASATKTLKGKDAEDMRENARKAMKKIFENYPPNAVSVYSVKKILIPA